jgi:hypothetical protein
MIKIDFEFDTVYGKFADALWFPDDRELPAEAEIEALKQQRLNNWVSMLSAPVEEIPADAPVEAPVDSQINTEPQ